MIFNSQKKLARSEIAQTFIDLACLEKYRVFGLSKEEQLLVEMSYDGSFYKSKLLDKTAGWIID